MFVNTVFKNAEALAKVISLLDIKRLPPFFYYSKWHDLLSSTEDYKNSPCRQINTSFNQVLLSF